MAKHNRPLRGIAPKTNQESRMSEEQKSVTETPEEQPILQEAVTQPSDTESVEVDVAETTSITEEVKPETDPQPEPVVVEAPQPATVPTAEKAPSVSEEEAYIEKMRTEGTEVQKSMIEALDRFSQSLRPRSPLEPGKACLIQFDLLRWFQWLGDKDWEDFRKGWNTVLVYWKAFHDPKTGRNTAQNYTPLSEFNTNRYLHGWYKGQDQFEAYTHLIRLVRGTRNAETRRHDIKQISIDQIAPNGISEKFRANLKQFYGN